MFLRNGLEPGHLLVLGLVLILLFGSKKLPETARALGRSLRIFKNETVALGAEVTITDAASALTPAASPVTPHAAPAPAVATREAAPATATATAAAGPGRTSAEGGPSRADDDQ
ncbi:twin-arginine translocase TatA/TatE family subunit [Microtetraspora malaysiensis]|uniref:twin-arginine translocase TatA/TatE family subunit n=1 Tax=Microtetraspora malaysiensis TaxID=161358 RepID=UPI0009FDA798|nr:twin-arginine translocase TatA/TatE family subunit [Microtetraspora malaysiensis]